MEGNSEYMLLVPDLCTGKSAASHFGKLGNNSSENFAISFSKTKRSLKVSFKVQLALHWDESFPIADVMGWGFHYW
jgi:hypothetical protein